LLYLLEWFQKLFCLVRYHFIFNFMIICASLNLNSSTAEAKSSQITLSGVWRDLWRSENSCRHAWKEVNYVWTCWCIHSTSWYVKAVKLQCDMFSILNIIKGELFRRLWNHGRAARSHSLVSIRNTWQTSMIIVLICSFNKMNYNMPSKCFKSENI